MSVDDCLELIGEMLDGALAEREATLRAQGASAQVIAAGMEDQRELNAGVLVIAEGWARTLRLAAFPANDNQQAMRETMQ